jgi:hypothetical protein
MKKLLTTILLFTVFYNISSSQPVVKNSTTATLGNTGYVGFYVGPSFPIGDYASTKSDSLSNPGYAKVGYYAEVNGGLHVFGLFELGITGFINSNTLNLDSKKDYLNQLVPGTYWDYTTKSWMIYGGMLGITFSYPTGSKIVLDARFQTGYLNASSPEITFNNNQNDTYKISERSKSTVTYLVAFGARYPLNKLLYLTGGVEYISATPHFDNVKTTTTIGGVTTEKTSSYSLNIQVISVSAGLKLML